MGAANNVHNVHNKFFSSDAPFSYTGQTEEETRDLSKGFSFAVPQFRTNTSTLGSNRSKARFYSKQA